MEELTNRSRAFAEAVVTMVWLVLLAVAFKGKTEVTGIYVPNFMLFLAGSAIITGICPLLACCIFKNKHAISDAACFFCAVILFYLASWIALFTVSEVIVVCVACMSLTFMELRIFSYWGEIKENGHPSRTKEFYTILDGSQEFMCCMTGIHFLWLESLALEGQISKSRGIQNALSEAMGIASILFFAVGLCAMHIEMTPPHTSTKMGDIAGPTFGLDTFMIISIGTVLGASMWKSLAFPGLQLLIVGPLIAAFVLLLHVSCPEEARVGKEKEEAKVAEVAGVGQETELAEVAEAAGVSPEIEQAKVAQEAAVSQEKDLPKPLEEPPKLAPLGLTKLMVTGFLTVSISVDSPGVSITNWFLVFAAAAIVSGLTWRLLTQLQVRNVLENNEISGDSQVRNDKIAAVASSAKTACFCAHTFIAIATVLLIFEICSLKHPTGAAAPAPAPACT